MKPQIKELIDRYKSWKEAEEPAWSEYSTFQIELATLIHEAQSNYWVGYSADDVLSLGRLNQILRAVELHSLFTGYEL